LANVSWRHLKDNLMYDTDIVTVQCNVPIGGNFWSN
jgi:hypothetical protein